MIWANFLHIYQPANQQLDILDRIVNESYRPLIKGMKAIPSTRLTLNINAGLTELLAKHGYRDVIDGLAWLGRNGRVEFTATAKYHTFLPLLPEREVIRQIKLNDQTNRKYFGKAFAPRGFFSTEMAYDKSVARIAKGLGYDWMIADEVAYDGHVGHVPYDRVHTVKGLGDFAVYFKEQRLSNVIVGAVVRSAETLLEEMGDERTKQRYLLTAMDGETFGHHRPGLENLLFEIFKSPLFEKVFISEIPKHFPQRQAISPIASTWSTKEEDIKAGLNFKLWLQPDNPVHLAQWKMTKFVMAAVERQPKKSARYKTARAALDKALASDQYWWASKFWWSLEVIEQGAYDLKQVVAGLSPAIRKQTEAYYRTILDWAFRWQRDGTIRQFHLVQQNWQKTPFKQRTPAEWYNQMILEFEDEMNKAAQQQEFEKAIKWRDAVIKLKSGADVFDVLHVVNELYSVRTIPSVKPFLEHAKFSQFAKEHFEPLPKGNKQPKGKYLPQ